MRGRTFVVAAWLGLSVACASSISPPAAPAAPAYSEYVFPQPADTAHDERLASQNRQAWQLLQGGDLAAASREYSSLVNRAPGYVAAEVGLGYVLLAQKKVKDAMAWFDHAASVAPRYWPALAGKAEGYLVAGQWTLAVASYEAALKLDPKLTDVSRRLEVIRFSRIRELVAIARRATVEGRLDDAWRAYTEALQSSPDSAVLHRDLGLIELKRTAFAEGLRHLRRAVELDASDTGALIALGGALEQQRDLNGALDAYERADRLESTDATRKALERLRPPVSTSRVPTEYRSIASLPQVSRGDFAALLGVNLQAWLAGSQRGTAALATDIRGHWASAWILAVVRAGVMDVYANHTFQPAVAMRRIDAAQVVARVLGMTANGAGKPSGRIAIGDMGTDHLGYADVAIAVSSGIMALVDGGQFRPSRPLTGAEAVEIVDRLDRATRRTTR